MDSAAREKREKGIGKSKRGPAWNRWRSSAEEERWWEGADGDGRFRERHAVWNKPSGLQVESGAEVRGSGAPADPRR